MTEREIIAKVNQRIENLGVSQHSIAKKIGISTSLLNRFLANRGGSMSFEKVCKLMAELNIDISVSCPDDESVAEEELEEDEEEVHRTLDKATYEMKMLKLKGNRDMEYDSKLYFAYQNLANAIILLAVDDYRRLLASNESGGIFNVSIDREIVTIESIEKFFKSGYYRGLTDVDGEYLISALKKEVKNGNLPL